MSKESGIGMTVTIDDSGGTGRAITNDVTNISFNTPRGAQDVTGLDKGAMERLLLLGDGQVTVNGVFNDAANASFDVLKTAGTFDSTRTVVIAVSGQTLSMEMILTGVNYSRGADGSLTWSATFQLADGTDPTWS